MSTVQNTTMPGGFDDTRFASFIAASSTLAQVIADVSKTPVSPLTGGKRVYDITASSTDAVANSLILWEGVEASLYANMGAVTTTASTNATVTRTLGSFITDGWVAGQTAMVLGSAATGNNGNYAVVTGVTASTLTFNGIPSGFTAQTEGAGFRVIRVARRAPVLIPANSGNLTAVSTAVVNVQVLGGGNSNDKTQDTLGLELGPNSLLLASLYQAASALPAVIQVISKAALR